MQIIKKFTSSHGTPSPYSQTEDAERKYLLTLVD